jgi:hypothetical protein
VIDTNISEALLSVNDIVVGSDEEKALVKAIKSSFPNSYSLIVGITLFVRYGRIIVWYLLSMILTCFVNSTVVSASMRPLSPNPLQWKNNSCESINHILKLNQDWKPEELPELINKIHKEIVLQESLVNAWCIVWSW